MFSRFSLKRVRCFSELELQQLARVNLIAGKNNTGKTALLEALLLHARPGVWHLPLDINQVRGIFEPSKAMEDVCGWLFYEKQASAGLELKSWDKAGKWRTLKIYILDEATSRERFPEAERVLGTAYGARQIFQSQQTNEPERFCIGVAGDAIGKETVRWLGAANPWNIPSVYLTSSVLASPQDVEFFGKIEAAKRQLEILPALQILESRLERLSLLPLAGQSVIHGDIGLPRLVPMPFMGEGMRRMLSIVLAIANAPGGVVLIDEIENGLHYSVMKNVWKAIAVAARQMDVQVFATTHSWECILAAHHAFKESGPYELRYFRLDRTKDENIEVKSLDEELLERVQYTDLEIR
jgi:hypothetical protein